MGCDVMPQPSMKGKRKVTANAPLRLPGRASEMPDRLTPEAQIAIARHFTRWALSLMVSERLNGVRPE